MKIPAWIIASRKAQVAIGSILLTLITRLLGHLGLAPDEINEVTRTMATIAGVWIASIAFEDANKPAQNVVQNAVQSPPTQGQNP